MLGSGTHLRWNRAVAEYVEHRRSREVLTPRYLAELRRGLRRIGDSLAAAGIVTHPKRFGEAQLDFLLTGPLRPITREDPSGLSPKTRIYYLAFLRQFLAHHGNPTLQRRRVRIAARPVRPRRLLAPAEAVRVLGAARDLGPYPYALTVLELTMGLRRSEALGLTLEQAARDPVAFTGKGRDGGKPRHVEASQRWRSEALPLLLPERRRLLGGLDGPWLFAYSDGTEARHFRNGWADSVMHRVFDRAGVSIPHNLHHANRRTFGKTLHLAGVPIEVISELMGHESIEQTKRYILIADDERASAMHRLDRALERGESG